jgi:hypothetical protein
VKHFKKLVGPLSKDVIAPLKPDSDVNKYNNRPAIPDPNEIYDLPRDRNEEQIQKYLRKKLKRPQSGGRLGRPGPIPSSLPKASSLRPSTAPGTRNKAVGGSYRPLPRQGAPEFPPLDRPLSPLEVAEFQNFNDMHAFKQINPSSPLGSPVANMTTTSLKPPTTTFNHINEHHPSSLLLWLHGRSALLGDYRITRNTESLRDLRHFIVAHLDHYWCASFAFLHRDGVEIAAAHESKLLLRDFVTPDASRSGVVIKPEHTNKTLRRHGATTMRRVKESERKKREKKAMHLHFSTEGSFDEGQYGSGYGKDLQLPDVVDMEGGESIDVGGEKRLSKEKIHNKFAREKIMGDYEAVKERIAVSYIANVERERAAAREELHVVMNAAALRIQSMYRCSKAKTFVEDVLLRLQAAAVLQGIVRRNKSIAVTATLRKEKLDKKEGSKRHAVSSIKEDDA